MQTGRRQKTTCHFQAAKPLQPADSAFFARFDKDGSVERLILPIIRSKQDEQFVPVANPSLAESSLPLSPNHLPGKDLRRESRWLLTRRADFLEFWRTFAAITYLYC